jgi:membrane fusion protein (multidrug efflux system)
MFSAKHILLPWSGRRWAEAGLPVLLVSVLLAWGATAQAQPPPVVAVMPVPVQDVSPSSEFVGRVEAINTVDIRARVEGFIQQRPFEEGQVVKEGQVLFVLESGPYQASLDAAQATLAGAQANLRAAESRLQRTQELRQSQAAAQATLEDAEAARDTAKANVLSAQANVRQAELNLGYTTIKSPLTGRIGRAAFSIGSLVGPTSDPLARVVQMDPIRVVFSVSDKAILQLRQDAAGLSDKELSKRFVPTLRLSTGEAYPASGSIEFVGNEVDPQTGTIPVWARFPNPDSLLVPGQFVTVVVRRAEPESRPLVPAQAVQQDRDGRYVLTVGPDNKVAIQRIRVSRQVGQDWVVEDGLKGGEQLIVQGMQNARPGETVQAVPAQSTAAPGDQAQDRQAAAPAGPSAR